MRATVLHNAKQRAVQVRSLDFDSDSDHIVTGSAGGRIRVWNVASRKLLCECRVSDNAILLVAFVTKNVVVAVTKDTIYAIDRDSGKLLGVEDQTPEGVVGTIIDEAGSREELLERANTNIELMAMPQLRHRMVSLLHLHTPTILSDYGLRDSFRRVVDFLL